MERVMPERKPNHRSPGAFTLVELLAVVAIVAILAALVIPAVGTLSDANHISNSALLVAGQFDLARQTALAENRLVEVRVYAIPTDNNTAPWSGVEYSFWGPMVRPLTGFSCCLRALTWILIPHSPHFSRWRTPSLELSRSQAMAHANTRPCSSPPMASRLCLLRNRSNK